MLPGLRNAREMVTFGAAPAGARIAASRQSYTFVTYPWHEYALAMLGTHLAAYRGATAAVAAALRDWELVADGDVESLRPFLQGGDGSPMGRRNAGIMKAERRLVEAVAARLDVPLSDVGRCLLSWAAQYHLGIVEPVVVPRRPVGGQREC